MTPPPADQYEALRLIPKRETQRDADPTPLALMMESPPPSHHYMVTEVRWSEAAHAKIQQVDTLLRNQSPAMSLPVTGLRSRLELADPRILRCDRNVGRYTQRIIIWTLTDQEESHRSMNRVVLDWLVNTVGPLIKDDAAMTVVQQLKGLARNDKAIDTSSRKTDPYAWETTQGHTAKAPTPSSYADLADFVARHLEGTVVFPDVAPLRRIISGDLRQNQAELMTDPLTVGRDQFSLVVRVRVLSYPGHSSPVIAIDFSRRIWTKQLKDKPTTVQEVSAYALPADSTQAFRFTLRKKRDEDGQWCYAPDDDFAPLARHFFPHEQFTTARIVHEGYRLTPCMLLVGHKHGVGARTATKSGVPDLDKVIGFRRITEHVASIGLHPWKGLQPITTHTRKAGGHQHWRRHDSVDHAKKRNYENWLQEAQDSIRTCYAGRHHLVIAVQPGQHIEADAQRAEERLQTILQGSVVTTRIPLPPDVHGPRADLPGKEQRRSADRAALRHAAWAPFIETVHQYEQREGCKVDGILVLARRWYANNRHDDLINKRAARIALATGLGVPVQYLLPHDEGTQDFEDRLMIAWLDLAYKSLGRVRPQELSTHTNHIYAMSDSADLSPDRILALGVVRRKQQRFIGNERSFLPYAIELDVKHGICTASFAYEDPTTQQLVQTDQLPFPQALVALATLGPIRLTSVTKDQQQHLAERTQLFFQQQLADFYQRSRQPLVLIDADTSRAVWPWLRDERLDAHNVHLAAGYHAEALWPNARLVRIRTNNSPKVVWDGAFFGTVEEDGEEVRYQAPIWAEADLLKLSDTKQIHVYLSFGSILRKLIRGRSCYREIPGMKQRQIAGARTYQATIMEPYTDAWTTPLGVEICVIRAGGDDPDRVAQLVEWLRLCYAHFGDWTVKPAPLYFERALKEYLADYELTEVEEADEIEEDM